MPQTLRSILGKSNRVSKASRPRARKEAQPTSPLARKTRTPSETQDDVFREKLDDAGLTRLMTHELTLRDVVQTMRYIRSKMFTPMPEGGLHSTRVTELLRYRASMPPLVTASHLHALLSAPSKVERELAELIAKGAVRKVRVETRGLVGESLVETGEYERTVRAAPLSQETQDVFLQYLRDNAAAQTLPSSGVLSSEQADELVREGFLTGSPYSLTRGTLLIRPEDRTTQTSIDHVSRSASGSLSAVGGPNAVHLAGGGGRGDEARRGAYRVAVPSHGRFLTMVRDGTAWIKEALGRTKWGESTEGWLQERFEAGGLYGKRWKEFRGVTWEWVLGEAVGLGMVEVFDTGSVGRGVRALGI